MKSVLAPIGVAEFFANYWEVKPLHISRSDVNYFSKLLTLQQIEHLLSSQDLHFPTVQLTQSNKSIPVQEYADEGNKIFPLRLIQHHTTGATIVLSQAHRLLPSLSDFCRTVQCAIQMRCQTNLYLSPPGEQGFNSHYDTHDVFILQVNGIKTFNFYSSGVELPFSQDKYDAALNTSKTVVEEITLNPGDTLYIPRGMVHDAVAHDSDRSLHITLGVFPIVMRDLLQEIVQVAAEKNVQYRCSLPSKVWTEVHQQNDLLHDGTRRLLDEAYSLDNLNEAISRLKDEVSINCVQDCTGLLSRLQRDCRITLSSTVEVREGSVMNVEREGPALRLRGLGQILEFGEPLSTAVEHLVALGKSRVSELTGLSDEQKLALSHQLLQENIIVTVDSD